MMTYKIDYYESADGTHIFEAHADTSEHFNSRLIMDALTEIYQNAQGNPVYIMLNLNVHYHLPLREFVNELKQFYKMVDRSPVFIALVLQPALVGVVETMVKTLMRREAIQNFTKPELGLLWLSIERKKRPVK